MGYEVHITRKFWRSDISGGLIKREEWLAYVEIDSEILHDSLNGENSFLYKYSEGEWPLWYDKSVAEIYSKNPSEKVISKMHSTAASLEARVLGDSDESYGKNGIIEYIPKAIEI